LMQNADHNFAARVVAHEDEWIGSLIDHGSERET